MCHGIQKRTRRLTRMITFLVVIMMTAGCWHCSATRSNSTYWVMATQHLLGMPLSTVSNSDGMCIRSCAQLLGADQRLKLRISWRSWAVGKGIMSTSLVLGIWLNTYFSAFLQSSIILSWPFHPNMTTNVNAHHSVLF